MSLKGKLTVQHSQSLNENLMKLISNEDQLTVSLQAVEAIDMAGIQLLYAFHKSCKAG